MGEYQRIAFEDPNDKWLEWLWEAEQAKCNHKGSWVNEGWCGPESGGAGGYCARCGYEFSVTFY